MRSYKSGMACRDHPAIGQRIARAGRRLRPVGVDQEAAVTRATEITAVHEQLVPPGHLDTPRRSDIAGVGEEQLRGQHAAGHRYARAVEVGQHGVEQPRALQHTGFQDVPVGRRDHQRQRVEVPSPGLGRAVPVGDGVTVAIDLDVGDAVVVDQAAHRRPKLVQAATSPLADTLGELLPGRPDIACRIDEFVVSADRAPAYVEQRLLGSRGAIPGQQVVDVMGTRCG